MSDLPEGWTDASAFPAGPLDRGTIRGYLTDRLAEMPSWEGEQEVVRFGVPMGVPDPLALEVLSEFTARNANNVGIHTRFGDGAAGTRRLEKEALSLLGGLLHGGALDGYVTSGATEATMQSVRIGRAVLRAAGTRPVVVTSALAHQSVYKAADLADLRLVRLPATGPDRITTPSVLAGTLEDLHADGHTGYVVVSTVGYFGTGSVDDIPALCDVLAHHQARYPQTRFYHHVDAAFGGLVLPFVDPSCGWDFRNRGVHSVAVDPHKTGLLPYSCGVFLCRKGLLEHVALNAHQSGVVDETLLGSRPGAAAAALWTVLAAHGFEGLRRIHTGCVELRDELQAAIREFDPRAELIAHPRMPVLAVSFSPRGRTLPRSVEQKYRLHAGPLPDASGTGTRDFYHFYLVPGHTVEHVKLLVDDLRQSLQQAPTLQRTAGDGLVAAVAAGSRATVCPRHVLVHPTGRRDPRLHPTGYSFHTFVPRRRTAETLRSVELRTSRIADAPVVLYASDLDRPFENELGGVAVDQHFHFEVLDRNQQYLSLIGAAHLTLHSPDQPGCAVANFYADGRLRSLELRVGRVGFADELQVFADRFVMKIGKSSKSIHRGEDDYSFSVDTAAEIRVGLLPGDQPAVLTYGQYNYDPLLPRARHLPRELYRRFPNRFFGEILSFEVGSRGRLAWAEHPAVRERGQSRGLLQESAVAGLALSTVDIASGRLAVAVRGIEGGARYRLDVPVDLGRQLTAALPRLDVSDPAGLDPAAAATHGEALYEALYPVVRELLATVTT